MADQNSISYRLRQNKSVDRELFISLLNRLSSHLLIENHSYIGMGGPFMEDFRIIHARLGINKMVSIESDGNIHERQKFNKPISNIKCINGTFESYLEKTKIRKPAIIWLDFSDPRDLYNQISVFQAQISLLQTNSILRITLNANPSTLGGTNKYFDEELKEFRFSTLKTKLREYLPQDATIKDIMRPQYGKLLLKALQIAKDKELLAQVEKNAIEAFSTYYADGQEMITYTLIIIKKEDTEKYNSILNDWEFHCEGNNPLIIDVPSLSSLERVTFESSPKKIKKLKFKFPDTKFDENPIDSFNRFRRVLPHFARVDL